MPRYRIEYHRVWVKTVEAESRKEARQIAEEEMGEESDVEDLKLYGRKKATQPWP